MVQNFGYVKIFFLQTFDLDQKTFQWWIKLKEPKVSTSKKVTPNTESLQQWLDIIPKVPSHYCRATSNRVYVDHDFKTKTQMHRIYCDWCDKNNKAPVMRKKFCDFLKDQKISIFKPRKDQCDVCVAHKEGNLKDEEYQLHVTKKDEARAAKERACSMMSPEVLVITMDMQSVLLCPKLLVSEQYYKTKLAIHNFTIYIKNTRDAHLYVWHEGDGGVTANNITSCIIQFLKDHCMSYKKVVLISDGCAYQNRNKVLCSALSNLSLLTGIEIEQIILEKGHTMMEVDSVHSTLERVFNPPIYSPSDYISRMNQARPSQPYIVNYLDYKFFKNYENVPGNFSSIRPGQKSGDATVNNIRGLLFKEGNVQYKIRHTDDWKILPQKKAQVLQQSEPDPLYEGPLKIEKSKYNSLQSLKRFMHRDFHTFYDHLMH